MQTIRRGVALALTCTLSLPLFSQAPPARPYGETIDVSIVNVDVVVTDRSGKRVRGLKADDFIVRDEGKAQEITNFSEFAETVGTASIEQNATQALPAATTAPPLPASSLADKRTIVVFIERFRIPPNENELFFNQVKTLLHQTLRKQDSAAIVSWNYVMKVRQDFTNNAAALDKALDQVKAENTQVEMDTESIILRNAYMEELIAEATIQQGGDAGAKSGTFSGDEGARQALVDIRRKANALHTLIRTMAGSPGKKVVLMATNRFSQYAGAEFYGNDMPSDKRVEFDTYDIRKQLAQAANAAGVTIYAIYPRGAEQVVFANVETRDRTEGMMVGPPGQTTYVGRNNERFLEDAKALGQSGKTLMNETAAIDQLAKDTGGVAAWGKTDIVRLTDAIRDDLGSYYSLAFRGSSSGKPHRLAIDTKNSSYSVRVRRDYIPQDDSVRMIERVRTSMYSRIDPPKVQFEVRTGAIKRNKKRFHIPVEVRIPMSELLAVPNENGKGSFSIYAATGGKLGALSDVVEKVQSFTLPATAPAADAVMTYKIEVIADGRADRLAIGVFDEGSKEWGVMNVRLELPDAKK